MELTGGINAVPGGGYRPTVRRPLPGTRRSPTGCNVIQQHSIPATAFRGAFSVAGGSSRSHVVQSLIALRTPGDHSRNNVAPEHLPVAWEHHHVIWSAVLMQTIGAAAPSPPQRVAVLPTLPGTQLSVSTRT